MEAPSRPSPVAPLTTLPEKVHLEYSSSSESDTEQPETRAATANAVTKDVQSLTRFIKPLDMPRKSSKSPSILLNIQKTLTLKTKELQNGRKQAAANRMERQGHAHHLRERDQRGGRARRGDDDSRRESRMADEPGKGRCRHLRPYRDEPLHGKAPRHYAQRHRARLRKEVRPARHRREYRPGGSPCRSRGRQGHRQVGQVTPAPTAPQGPTSLGEGEEQIS